MEITWPMASTILLIIGLIAKIYHDHMRVGDHETRVKCLEKVNTEQTLAIQELIKKEEAYEKFIHKNEYNTGMRNLEDKLVTEMAHLNKTLDAIYGLVQDRMKGN